jgi:hypothetical protein
MHPNWESQELFPPRSKKIWGDETAQSLANQSAVISNGGWRVAAWAISYAGISRDGLMLPHLGCGGLRQSKSAAAVEHLQLNRTAAD